MGPRNLFWESPWWLLLSAAALLLVWYLRRQAAKQSTEATCRTCGYAVRGLPSSICPECGSDLSAVGAIREPGEAPRLRHNALLGIIALILVPIAMVCTRPLLMLLAPRSVNEQIYLVPASGRLFGLSIIHEGFGHWPRVPVGTIELSLTTRGRFTAVIEVEPESLECRYPGPKFQPTKGRFDRDLLLSVYRTLSLPVDDSAAAAEADDIQHAVEAIAHRRTFTWGTAWAKVTPFTVRRLYMPASAWAGAIACWTVLGLAVFEILIWRQRRSVKRLHASHPA